MKKKWAAAVLVMSTALALAACGETKSAEAVVDDSKELTQEDLTETAETDAAESDTQEESEDTSDAAVTIEDGHLTTPQYTAEIPSDWEGGYCWDIYDQEDGYSISFQNKAAKDKNEGGNLCSIQLSEELPIFIEYIGGDFIGELRQTDGDSVYYLAVSYPTDVQSGETTMEEYNRMAEGIEDLKASIQAADGWEFTGAGYEEVMANYEQETYGVMVDASMHSFTLVDYSGQYITFSGEDIDASSIADGVQPGHCYRLNYKGILEYGGGTENATFVSLTNVDSEAPQKDYDASYMAAQVLLAFHNMDINYLAGLCRYPLTIDGDMVAESAKDLTSHEFSELFTDELCRCVNYCNLYDAEITGDSYRISLTDEMPGVTIEKTEDGTWMVTEITNLENKQ